jgi:hypothetical protein
MIAVDLLATLLPLTQLSIPLDLAPRSVSLQVAAVVNVKAEYAPECTRTDGVAAPIPEVDVEVTYIGEMAIYSASVRSPQANAGVLATVVLMSDPDDLSSAAEPSVNVDDAADDGPTDAVVRGTNKAHAQPLSPASPKVCFLSTATPTNRDVPSGSVVHSSPHSDDDSDPGYAGDDHQPAQSPAAGGAATLESSLRTELPPFTVPSPTTSRAPTAESWVADVVPVIEIRPSEQTPQVDSRHRAEAATRAILKTYRTKKEKKREKEKRRRKTSAVVNPNARHPCGGAGLIRVTTPGPVLDSKVGGRMSIHSRSAQRRIVGVVATSRSDSDPDEMGSPAESSDDVDDAVDDGPTDAVFQPIDEAHVQPVLSASPETCFLLQPGPSASPETCFLLAS